MREKILIVDDDPEIRSLCQESLGGEDYEVVTSASGEEALEMATQSSFDVVLSDIRMPGISGIELLESLKRANPEQVMVMFSGFTDVDVAVEAMRLGAIGSLSKPLIVDELKLTINQALHQNRLRQENVKLKMELHESHVAQVLVPKLIPLLQNFSLEACREFVEMGRIVGLGANEILLEEGVADQHLYIVFEGELTVWQDGVEVHRLGKGESYGEMSVFRPGMRSPGLATEIPSQVCVIEREAIMNFFSRKEERLFKLFIFNALNSIFTKYRKSNMRIVQLERMLKG
ncbi:MAG: response regulator [Gaiellales bacterium]|nr:MAG: response regulator [Gaiellales bacterium]